MVPQQVSFVERSSLSQRVPITVLEKILSSCVFLCKGSESMLFEDYLNTKELTPNLVNYILHSIAMVPNSATTIEVCIQTTFSFLSLLLSLVSVTRFVLV